MITPRMCQVKYDASLRTVLSKFRFTLWGPAPHHSLKNRIFFWLPARWASGFSGDHQQDHQCLWLLLCYSFVLSFIVCILLGIKLLLLLQSRRPYHLMHISIIHILAIESSTHYLLINMLHCLNPCPSLYLLITFCINVTISYWKIYRSKTEWRKYRIEKRPWTLLS